MAEHEARNRSMAKRAPGRPGMVSRVIALATGSVGRDADGKMIGGIWVR
jgi:hypothetical protein